MKCLGRIALFKFASFPIAVMTCGLSAGAAEPDRSTVTFNRDVAPIVYEKCAVCHRPGDAAPFSLLSYDDARRRARQIAEVTSKRFMPPWLPKEGHGEFAGTRRLTNREIETINQWAAAGAPRGEENAAPPAPKSVDGWQLGPPDMVLESPPFKLDGAGGDVFRNFVVPIDLPESRWVESIELRPANPRVTHHARLGVDSTYESIRRDAEGDLPGYEGMAWGEDPDGQLVTWAPGMVARPGTPGTAWRLHPKTCLVLHTHMQPSGKRETVQFRIGLHFAEKPPTKRPVMLRVGGRHIDIPPGEANYVVRDEYTLPVDIDVHSIFPHAHSLCQTMRVDAELPDGSHQPLIRIDQFDERWHDNYEYASPVRLPRGTKLVTEFSYDNTEQNIRNRNHPPRRVVYGSNVVDEMSDVYLRVTVVHPDQREKLVEDFKQRELHSQLAGFGMTMRYYPNDPWSREGIAACYLGLKTPAKAIRVLEDRLKLGPPAVHAIVTLGMAYIADGDFAQAEKLHRQALAMDDIYPFAWLGLGNALVGQQKTDEAEQAFRKAVELAPGLSDAHLKLADLLLKQGHLNEAATECESAIKTSPDDANCLLKLAEIRTRQGRIDDSLAILQSAQRLAPYIHPPKVVQAVYLFQSGDQAQATKLLNKAHAELPDHSVPELFLGQLALGDKELDDARKYLDGAASRAIPDNWPESHKKRFLILLHSERFKLAQQTQDAALAKDAISEWLKYEPDNLQLREIHQNLTR